MTTPSRAVSVLMMGAFALIPLSVAEAATAFTEGFESRSFSAWTAADTGTKGLWVIDTSRETGRYSAQVTGNTGKSDDVIRKAVSTALYTSPTLSFSYKASSLDSKSSGEFDQFFVEYSTNGTTWTVLKEVNGKSVSDLDGSWRKVSYAVPSHAGFQFRFRAHLSDSGDRVWIDNVSVSGTPKEDTPKACSDFTDNDEDGLTDYADPECVGFYASLSVMKEGQGSGAISSSPAGISCGTDCVERYVKSLVVTLTATPTFGSVFAGWGGACAGASCAVSMAGGDASVTAYFEKREPGICADAVVDWNESCDDGNEVEGDGCSATCDIEQDFVCAGSPSGCFWNGICPFGWNFSGTVSYPICTPPF